MKNYNIKNKRHRIVDGVKIQTLETEINSKYNSMSVEVGTNGYLGVDSFKNSRTFIKIMNVNNTDMIIKKDSNGDGFSVGLRGNSELDTMIEALEFAVLELKHQRNNNRKNSKSNPTVFATEKQILFLKKLLKKRNLVLTNDEIDIKTATELINSLKDKVATNNILKSYPILIKKRGEEDE